MKENPYNITLAQNEMKVQAVFDNYNIRTIIVEPTNWVLIDKNSDVSVAINPNYGLQPSKVFAGVEKAIKDFVDNMYVSDSVNVQQLAFSKTLTKLSKVLVQECDQIKSIDNLFGEEDKFSKKALNNQNKKDSNKAKNKSKGKKEER